MGWQGLFTESHTVLSPPWGCLDLDAKESEPRGWFPSGESLIKAHLFLLLQVEFFGQPREGLCLYCSPFLLPLPPKIQHPHLQTEVTVSWRLTVPTLRTIPRLDPNTMLPCGRITCLSWSWAYFALRLYISTQRRL